MTTRVESSASPSAARKQSSKIAFFNNNFKKSQQQSGHTPNTGSKKRSHRRKKFGLFKINSSKTPGNIKQVRGAQYPPIMTQKNAHPIKYHDKNRRNSTPFTINANNQNGYHRNYKAQPHNNNKNSTKQSKDDHIINISSITDSGNPIDIEKLIQSVKEDQIRLQQQSQIYARANSKPNHNNNNNNNNSRHSDSYSDPTLNPIHVTNYPPQRQRAKHNDANTNNHTHVHNAGHDDDGNDIVDNHDNTANANTNLNINIDINVDDNHQRSEHDHHQNALSANTKTHSTQSNGVSNKNGAVQRKPQTIPPQIPVQSPPKLIKEWDQIQTESEAHARKNRNRINLLNKMLSQPTLDVNLLRKACWRGIPTSMRPTLWKLLLGYIPKNLSRRKSSLNKKRGEYYHLMDRYYNQQSSQHRSDQENGIVRQIGLDVPRTSPELKLFQIECIDNLLSRALYIWSLKHTATGYVQGINDLITPFVYIFLDEYIKSLNIKYTPTYNTANTKNTNNHGGSKGCILSIENLESRAIIAQIDSESLLVIEADSYWCLDYLIEGLQLNYTDNQPGIQKMNLQLISVIQRVNNKLYLHLKAEQIQFIQFSFRWMNCLLMRELSLTNIIRLWDTYLCEGVELSAGFSEFHVFVCAALLLSFSDELMSKDFSEIMLFIQAMPDVTAKWGERQIETILSEAYVYQQLFGSKNNSKSYAL